MASVDKDPRRSLHIGYVPTPELAPDEAFVAVMASSINFNTVWTSIFEPVSTFGPLARLGRESEWARRHDQPYQVIGSDAAGVVLRVGAAVRNWKPGDRVTVHCNYVDDQDQTSHDDSMMASNQRSGATRPTSAGSPTSPSSRSTNCCRSPRTSRGKRPRSMPCATRPATGCWCRETGQR